MCLDVVVLTFHVGIGRCVSWVENKVKQVLGGWPGSMHNQLSPCLFFFDVKFFRMTGGMFNQLNKVSILHVQADLSLATGWSPNVIIACI